MTTEYTELLLAAAQKVRDRSDVVEHLKQQLVTADKQLEKAQAEMIELAKGSDVEPPVRKKKHVRKTSPPAPAAEEATGEEAQVEIHAASVKKERKPSKAMIEVVQAVFAAGGEASVARVAELLEMNHNAATSRLVRARGLGLLESGGYGIYTVHPEASGRIGMLEAKTVLGAKGIVDDED